jgi:putative adhesin
MRSRSLLLVLLCSAAACGRRSHESQDAFRWEQEIPPGSTIHLGTITGRIDVVPTHGRSALVGGSTQWVGRKDPIRFASRRDGNDFYVCALWTTRGDCGDSGDHFGGSDHSWLDIFSLFKRRSTNAVASLRVSLPPGVKVDAHTVNGTISMRGVTSGINARVLNGSIEIDKSAGPVEAKGTNGSIEVALDSLAPDDQVVLESVNGSMTAVLPSTLEAEVQLSTVNGSVKSDFPINTSGEISNRHLHGQIGRSSREVLLKTINGNISLLKQQGEPPAATAPPDHAQRTKS